MPAQKTSPKTRECCELGQDLPSVVPPWVSVGGRRIFPRKKLLRGVRLCQLPRGASTRAREAVRSYFEKRHLHERRQCWQPAEEDFSEVCAAAWCSSSKNMQPLKNANRYLECFPFLLQPQRSFQIFYFFAECCLLGCFLLCNYGVSYSSFYLYTHT